MSRWYFVTENPDGYEVGGYDEASIRYLGRNNPSKSFHLLQQMTGGSDSLQPPTRECHLPPVSWSLHDKICFLLQDPCQGGRDTNLLLNRSQSKIQMTLWILDSLEEISLPDLLGCFKSRYLVTQVSTVLFYCWTHSWNELTSPPPTPVCTESSAL